MRIQRQLAFAQSCEDADIAGYPGENVERRRNGSDADIDRAEQNGLKRFACRQTALQRGLQRVLKVAEAPGRSELPDLDQPASAFVKHFSSFHASRIIQRYLREVLIQRVPLRKPFLEARDRHARGILK